MSKAEATGVASAFGVRIFGWLAGQLRVPHAMGVSSTSG